MTYTVHRPGFVIWVAGYMYINKWCWAETDYCCIKCHCWSLAYIKKFHAHSAEHYILNARKYKNIKKFSFFFQAQISRECYFSCFVNVKMPTIVGNCQHFNIYAQEKIMLSWVEYIKSFITSGPELTLCFLAKCEYWKKLITSVCVSAISHRHRIALPVDQQCTSLMCVHVFIHMRIVSKMWFILFLNSPCVMICFKSSLVPSINISAYGKHRRPCCRE